MLLLVCALAVAAAENAKLDRKARNRKAGNCKAH